MRGLSFNLTGSSIETTLICLGCLKFRDMEETFYFLKTKFTQVSYIFVGKTLELE